ncbi:MAG: hypothetical protein UIG59_03065 [Acutalibacteraceae bacterium]|nr:hypothetical protein [Acutalibacteraceae bacterium]
MMKYEVKLYSKRHGGEIRQTFKTYTQAWRYGQYLEKRNIHYIINPKYDV